MGLIYVNPEGPNGNPDPVASGRDVRETFRRMAMNDEETVALVAGGHAFGKMHGAGIPDLGAEPEGFHRAAAPGWKNSFESGVGVHATTSGHRRAWTPTPTKWDNNYLEMLFGQRVGADQVPAGAQGGSPGPATAGWSRTQVVAKVSCHTPMMTTADMSMRMDPIYNRSPSRFREPGGVGRRFRSCLVQADPPRHGSKVRYLGPEVPPRNLIWQDPVPAVDHALVDDTDRLSSQGSASSPPTHRRRPGVHCLGFCLDLPQQSDHRGGANGGRIRLSQMSNWEANKPETLRQVLSALESVQSSLGFDVSMADLIVLGGTAAVESAAAAESACRSVSTSPPDVRRQRGADRRRPRVAWSRASVDGFRNYREAQRRRR